LFKTRTLAADAVKGGRVHINGIAERERQAELRRLGAPVSVGRRPTKRDRRRYDSRPY